MSDAPRLPEGYEFSADPDRIDAVRVHHWLSTDTYWARGRTPERHGTAMSGSLNFGVYEEASGRQVAYARVVTDGAFFAWLADVYVDPAARGTGLGTALVASVLAHLRPLGLRRVLLATEDAHGVYEKVGFRPLERPHQWMAHLPG